MQSDSVVSVDCMTVVHDKDCALNRPDALYAGRECDCSVIKAAQPQVEPPLYIISKDADGKVVVTTTAQPLPVAWLQPETLNACDPVRYAELRAGAFSSDYDDWFPVYAAPVAQSQVELLEIIRTARAYIGILEAHEKDEIAKKFLGSLYNKMTEAIKPILP
jgi:hypothetical protein